MKLNISKEWLLKHIDENEDCSAGSPGAVNAYLKLSKEDSLLVADALLNPPEPCEKMIEAFKRYKKRTSK
jgi:hypothetical protein